MAPVSRRIGAANGRGDEVLFPRDSRAATAMATAPNEPISAIPRSEWRGGPLTAGASARRRSRSLEARETADIVGHVTRHPRNDLSTEPSRGRSAREAVEARVVFRVPTRGSRQRAIPGGGQHVWSPSTGRGDRRPRNRGRPTEAGPGWGVVESARQVSGLSRGPFGPRQVSIDLGGGEQTGCGSRGPAGRKEVGELEVREPGDHRLTDDGGTHVGGPRTGCGSRGVGPSPPLASGRHLRTAYLCYRANKLPNWAAGRRV